MQKKIQIAHAPTRNKQMIFWIAAIILVVVSYIQMDFDWELFRTGVKKIPGIARGMMHISWEIFPTVLDAMVLTLAIAALGLLISTLLALILGFLIASNTAPSPVLKMVIGSVCIIIRTIPTTIWVLLAVASAGFGATSAVLGLALPTIAYLAKTFANQIEACGKDLKETMTSLGTAWPVSICRGFLPMCRSGLMAVVAFRFEMSVSESTVLGLVGCGGIGYLISRYIKAYKFGELTTCLMVVLVVMYALEMCTAQVRKAMRKNRNE